MTNAPRIMPMSPAALAKVTAVQAAVMQMPQVYLTTEHIIHGGMYARTITMAAGTLLVGALIKIPTLVIINGHCTVTVGDHSVDLEGYQVLPASAGRKQIWFAHEDTDITMIFPSRATSVDEAEAQFTDEASLLMSRTGDGQDTVTITGD